MARIPLEDNYTDVISKAQRGLAITDEQLAHRAEVTPEQLTSLKAGKFDEVVARRVARHLRIHPSSLVALANNKWYPEQSVFRTGFYAFNTACEDMTVNNYIIWDERTRHAILFDTGANCEPVLDFIAQEKLLVRSIFLTHTHSDHIAELPRLVRETKAEVWASEREPVDFPGAKTFAENTTFHLGNEVAIKTLSTWGHSPGGTTYFVTGLSYPLAIVGDAIFASSMGAGLVSHDEAWRNTFHKILTLPAGTVLACGHGPLTTVRQERKHNPFFMR